jgi:hypothetical protein
MTMTALPLVAAQRSLGLADENLPRSWNGHLFRFAVTVMVLPGSHVDSTCSGTFPCGSVLSASWVASSHQERPQPRLL